MRLTMQGISEEEYSTFIQEMDEDYYVSRSRADGIPLEEARAFAVKQIADIRSKGFETPGHSYHHLMLDGQRVGRAWLWVKDGQAYLYDLQLKEDVRGQGLGKEAMTLIENYARLQGAAALRLNVFGFNTVAQNLYRRQGFEVASMQMKKKL